MLSETDGSLGKTIERLSSGFKINSAADDPAGLVISEKLRAQVGGLDRAIRNAGDAVNMVKTAEAALNEVSRILRSMRDLAVHAANTGPNDSAAIDADQAQIKLAIQSLNKIAEETQFGNKKLLDGTAGISTKITGTHVVSASLANAVNVATGSVAITITQQATKATMYGQTYGTGHVAGSSFNAGSAASFTLNGFGITVAAGSTMEQAVTAINAKTAQTGVVASWNLATLQVKLTQVSYGSDKEINLQGAEEVLGTGTSSALAVGLNVKAGVTQEGPANVSDTVWESGTGLLLRDSLGNSIAITEAANTAGGGLGDQFVVESGALEFQVGAYANQIRQLNLRSMFASQLGATAAAGENVSTIDLHDDPQQAILILDAAIADVSNTRAELGAAQRNVFESAITSLSIARENIAASESTIRDTDMAEEVVNLTRNQILQQAGTAMLAQANQTPQTLLKLLQ